MRKTIALFNHKGGVSKTTTTFNLGWVLAERGHRVVMVDADPQCNLTGLVVDYSQSGNLDEFYENNPNQNLFAALSPAFESRPEPIQAVGCVSVEGRDGLSLLPGHVNLSEYEVTLGIAQELSGTLHPLRNLPGASHYLLSKVAEAERADYVLIDMNPSLGAFNQNLLMTSDYFLVPTAPDYFNLMALRSLSTVLPKWLDWASRAHDLPSLSEATYPFPERRLKFLGTVIQKYRPRKGEATVGFQKWIDDLNSNVQSIFFPAIQKAGATLAPHKYESANVGHASGYCLAQIPDFNTLIAVSQKKQTPVFALTDNMFDAAGTVLRQQQAKRAEFRQIFEQLATAITDLSDNG